MKEKNYYFEFEALRIKITEKKIKSIRLKIEFDTLEIKCSIPKYFSKNELFRFLESKKNWIYKNLENLKKSKPSSSQILFFGKYYPFENFDTPSNSKLEFDLEKFTFFLNQKEDWDKLLEKFYLQNLEEFINQIKPIYEFKMDLKISEIRFRKMKSRWGSCLSSKKKICLNTWLAKRTKFEIESVLVHEMIHFLVPNHGIEFKKNMSQFFPEWKKANKALSNLLA